MPPDARAEYPHCAHIWSIYLKPTNILINYALVIEIMFCPNNLSSISSWTLHLWPRPKPLPPKEKYFIENKNMLIQFLIEQS